MGNKHHVRTYKREDLKTFDDKAWQIVSDAQEAGWRGRLSNRGHMLLRAPDGEATISVSRKYDQKRAGSNARAELDRWLRANLPDVEHMQALHKGVRQLLPEAARGVVAQVLDEDRTMHHPQKVILQRMCDQDDVAVALASAMAGDDVVNGRLVVRKPMPLIVTHDLDRPDEHGITKDSKPWRIQWVVADPDTHDVIGFGGPRMDPDKAADALLEYLAQAERVKALARQEAVTAAVPDKAPADANTPKEVEPAMKMYVCGIDACDKTFEKPLSLARHRANEHPTIRECPHCHGKFKRLDSHLRSCPDNPEQAAAIQCGKCGGMYHPNGFQRHSSACNGVPSSRGGAASLRMPQASSQDTPATGGQARLQVADLVRALPQIADPLGALMNLLAEVEELRASRPDDLRAQIVELTTERDEAIKRAEEAEGKIKVLQDLFK